MSKFELRHPTEPNVQAEYGVDPGLGFFVEVRQPGKRKAEYDALRPGYADLDGALRFFVSQGFFDQEALEDAKEWLADEGGEGRRSAEVHCAATIICHLKDWSPPKEPPLQE